MNVISFTCPKCGASVRARETDTKAHCYSCGNDIFLDDYVNEAGDFSDEAYADALATELDKVYDTLISYGKISAEKEVLEKQKATLAQMGGISESFGRLICYIVASIIAIVLMVLLNVISAPMIIFFIAGVAATASYLLMGTIMIQFQQNTHLNMNDLNAAIDEREDKMIEYDKVLKAHRDVFIPEKYRNKQALEIISEALRTHEAYSINEALEIYDELLLRDPTLARQQEQEKAQLMQLSQTALLPQGDISMESKIRNAIEYMGGMKIFFFVTGLVLLSFIIAGAIAG
ncbi:MAG: hypothetical protein IKG93_13245 [Clostridiales bacterium]|nr:hypothetical protein [Clostridiales bacterium]